MDILHTSTHKTRGTRPQCHRPRAIFLRREAPGHMRTERKKVAPQRPFARPLHQPSSKMAWSVGAASSASKNRRLTDLQDGAQRASAGWGLVRNGGGGEGGWQRFGTRLASAKTSHVDDHVVSARRKLTSGALRGLRSTVEKSTLRTPGRGREGRPGLWAAQGHQRAAQRPICAPILQRCPNPSGAKVCVTHPGRPAGGLTKGLTGRLP